MGILSDLADGLTGRSSRKAARREARKADERIAKADALLQEQADASRRMTDELRQQIQGDTARWNNYYAPIERDLAMQLRQGPDTEGQAAIARNEYLNQFDVAQENARREAIRYGVQPGSEAMRRTRDAATANSAMGAATAATQARRAEEDRHYMRQSAFFQNGAGLKGQIYNKLRDTYGADIDSYGRQIQGNQQFANLYQGNADRHSAEASSALGSTMNMLTQAGLAYATGGASLAATGLPGQNGAPAVGVPREDPFSSAIPPSSTYQPAQRAWQKPTGAQTGRYFHESGVGLPNSAIGQRAGGRQAIHMTY